MAVRHSTDELGIDRRQQRAAAVLLMGFNLPAPMQLVAEQLQKASEICPGLRMDEISPMNGPEARVNALLMARDLINEMIEEVA